MPGDPNDPAYTDAVVEAALPVLRASGGRAFLLFATLRALYAWMWALPGAPLVFMGAELAPFNEWNESAGLPWHLLDHAPHRGVRDPPKTGTKKKQRSGAAGVPQAGVAASRN